MAVRLNKYLADRGVGARRKCDELIAQGRVSVNGRVVSDLGSKVEEGRDRVLVDGRPVAGKAQNVYYVLNKPVGVITTLDDPHGRRSVAEFLPRGARVYPVGRLDADTSGLLLLTNDGHLAHQLMHPRYGVHKVYRVRLAEEPRADQLRRLAQGVRFDGPRVSAPAQVRRIDPGFDAIMIELIIHEGRFRQVRRMCEAVGLTVTGLHRVGYGPLRLGPLARGMFRELSEEEVARLRAAASRPGGSRFERSRPAPARAAKPPASATPDEPADDEAYEEREETFIPGGGLLEPLEESEGSEEAPSWPARSGARRGDADWQSERERPAAERRSERAERGGSPRSKDRTSGRTAPRADRDRAPSRTTGRAAPRASREGARFDRGPAPARGTGRAAPRASREGARFDRGPAPARSTGRGRTARVAGRRTLRSWPRSDARCRPGNSASLTRECALRARPDSHPGHGPGRTAWLTRGRTLRARRHTGQRHGPTHAWHRWNPRPVRAPTRASSFTGPRWPPSGPRRQALRAQLRRAGRQSAAGCGRGTTVRALRAAAGRSGHGWSRLVPAGARRP